MVRAGLTPYQALRTGTYNVARHLGQLDSSGTVAVGKRADLLLLRGNPLQDVRYTREPAGVMIHGRWLDRAALDQRLLASKKAWFWSVAMLTHRPAPMLRDAKAIEVAVPQLEMLIDSLEGASAPVAERLVPRVAEVLGTIRRALPPDEREGFDPKVRVWLREQARRGHRVAVSDVPLNPAP
jgi:hypothetical protein